MNPILWMLTGVLALLAICVVAFWVWFIRMDRELNELEALGGDPNSEALRVQSQKP